MAEYVTPLMQQFAAIKAEYSDCLILFRLGDFYELFAEDAHIGADLLGITLTRKAQSKGGDVPMAGVPFHALDTHLPKLVAAGHKVALVEQLVPADGRTLVAREVVRIITPGTALSDSVLNASDNRYFATFDQSDDQAALAFADLSTGDILFSSYSGSPDEHHEWLVRELERFLPAELVVSSSLGQKSEIQEVCRRLGIILTRFAGWEEWTRTADQKLHDHLQVATLEPFELHQNQLARETTAALIGYATYTQRQNVPHLRQIKSYSPESGLQIDTATQRNLELFTSLRHQDRRGTLLKHLDHTTTPLGSRTLQMWLRNPQADLETIHSRQASVAELLAHPSQLTAMQQHLRQVGDIERLTSRVTLRLGTPRDLLRLGLSLLSAEKLARTLETSHSTLLSTLTPQSLPPLKQLAEKIITTLDPETPNDLTHGGVILAGVDSDLDTWRHQLATQHEWMVKYEQQLRQETGISTLKVRNNKVFGFYIEVSRGATSKVPDHFERKQTLVNGERYSTPELKQQERTLLEAQAKILEKEYLLFSELLDQVKQKTQELQNLAKKIGTIDTLTALASVAQAYRYVKPEIHTGSELEIIAGRHPVVEALLEAGDFVPNDSRLDSHAQAVVLLTGPNMGGKSVYLRQTALITLLAHLGSFVPAESAKIPLTDRIFVRSGAADNITDGLSTFMVEMVETATILRHCTARSLILLDEVGRGTSTYDGLSLAWAIVEHIATQPAGSPKTIFATHYLELQQLSELFRNVSNAQVAVHQEKDTVVFLHQVLAGGAAHSFGVSVAAMAGVPESITTRARELLKEFETKHTLLSLTRAQKNIIDELKSMRILDLTPTQALTQLEKWQEMLVGKEKE